MDHIRTVEQDISDRIKKETPFRDALRLYIGENFYDHLRLGKIEIHLWMEDDGTLDFIVQDTDD